MECALTGDPISAERAHHHGLVNVLCEDGGALDAAMALADRICANAPVAVRASRKVVLEATNAPDDVGWKMSVDGHGPGHGQRGLQGRPHRLHREAPAELDGQLATQRLGGEDASSGWPGHGTAESASRPTGRRTLRQAQESMRSEAR